MIDPADLTNALLAVLLAALAAGNPPRRLVTLPALSSGRLATAAAVTAGPLLVLGWAAGAVLDALAISPPAARLAAGLVLAAVSLLGVVSGTRPLAEPAPGIVVPLVFPLLLRPELALVVLVAGADHGAAGATAAVGLPLALTPLLALVVPADTAGMGARRVDGPCAALGRLVAALGVLVGVGLVMDGIFAL